MPVEPAKLAPTASWNNLKLSFLDRRSHAFAHGLDQIVGGVVDHVMLVWALVDKLHSFIDVIAVAALTAAVSYYCHGIVLLAIRGSILCCASLTCH